MKQQVKNSIRSFVIELFIYAALVIGYFFLVLNFLGGWLSHLYERDRKLYAAIALILIVCQGFLLEGLTRFLLALTERGGEEK